MENQPKIAILGGTGSLGSGLAKRWVKAGFPVIVGSRTAEKAHEAASALTPAAGGPAPTGLSNYDAAKAADIVVLTVPFSNHDAILDEIKDVVEGKIVVDAVVPLVPPKVAVVQLPPEGSAGMIAQNKIGEKARVVSAFQNVGADKLQAEGDIACDILVTGNDVEARKIVISLIEPIGMRGIDAGAIANSAAAEAMTSLLIGINKRYKVDCAGIQITGINR
ncbi:MAG TPA: NADPH-dependent F420 reductase [Pusillimonas sp.]|jgi:NADPH-dependent F420 reductase|nr:NADPH-dependent F420 reductase [Pusillimonas sp.]MBC43093.1 NADPH-dependent F420 reductase [Pusillimonas sp.]HBT33263.1 NADPH-dependent F420 reductase [Pusillimonas sp.]HCP79224.1 NADPH-dependent F420 reductase [Pusillimonas sp.]|tara:strand:- start:52286 stop:52948 length:663 start_codon:yes stop_codon:yes gene_type:complete